MEIVLSQQRYEGVRADEHVEHRQTGPEPREAFSPECLHEHVAQVAVGPGPVRQHLHPLVLDLHIVEGQGQAGADDSAERGCSCPVPDVVGAASELSGSLLEFV